MKPRKKSAQRKVQQPGSRLLVGGTMTFVVVVYGIFVFFPIIYGFITSFFNWNPFNKTAEFVGFGNYSYVVHSPEFWTALVNTIIYTLGTMVLTIGIALLLAAIMHGVKKGMGFYRGIFFLPVISSAVATCILWKFIFNYDNGLLNSILMHLGFNKVPWLMNSKIALAALIFVGAWKDIGYALVLILAGINNIDPTIYESAAIDGASKVRQFFSITMPLIRNTMTILIISKLVDYMQVYTSIKFITSGGPGKKTWTMAFYIYEQAFSYYNFGYASAVSFLLFFVIFIMSLVQLKMDSKSQ